MERKNLVTEENTMQPQTICMEEGLCFAADCGSCGYYSPDDPDSGWCRLHGGWVSPDKWACDDYT